MKRFITLVIMLFAGVASANADSFTFHFVGGTNIADINLTGSLMSGNQYLINAGTLTVTDGVAKGDYSLVTGGPGVTASASGRFIFDNILYVGSDPLLDVYGLLFAGNGMEVNIWGNARPSDYSFYRYNTALGYYDVAWDDPPEDPASLTPIATPEPSSLALIAAGIGCISAFGMRKRWVRSNM